VSHADLVLLGRVAVGFALGYILGFERGIRGSPAGDRTFALIGASATAVTAVAEHSSPQTIAGVITGVGFIGAGVVFQASAGLVRGLTSAATIFSAAAIGVVVGYGHLLLGVLFAGGILLTLELRFIPGLRFLDSSRHRERFRDDHPPDPPETTEELGG
jgi:putative Mg2+ transporter-C (MgtC) family protein